MPNPLGHECICMHAVLLCSDNPGILDYIRLKHEVVELQKQLSDWKRKVDIAGMERTRTRSLLRNVAQSQGASSVRLAGGASSMALPGVEVSAGSGLGRMHSGRG